MIRSLDATPCNLQKARKAGQSAAYKGIKYDEGKGLFSSYEAPLLLAWSEGHNDARVQKHFQNID